MVSLTGNDLKRGNPANVIARKKISDTHLRGDPLGVEKRTMSPSPLEATSYINPKTADTSSTRSASARGMMPVTS